MSTPDQIRLEPYTKGPAKIPSMLLGIFTLFAIVGAIGLVMGIGADPQRAWQAYMINMLFFIGLGTGGVLFACVIHMASGRWGREVKRIAEGFSAFMPMLVVLFVIMIPGLKYVLPWVKHPYGPQSWLNLEFLIVRTLFILGVFTVLGAFLIYRSLRLDIGIANAAGANYSGPIHKFITRNWGDPLAEEEKARRSLSIWAPIYALLFAILLTFLALDLIMSLKKGWYSTLIGGYYFAGCFYITLAALLIAVIWSRKRFNLHDKIKSKHLHDIAKLCMAFGIVTGDFFYAQLMLIWYGNFPIETSYVIDRWSNPYRAVGVAVMLLCFALPLLAMLNRRLKEKSGPMLVFGTVVLCAMWMERMLAIAPSISGPDKVYFGLTEILVTMGFVGLFGLVYTVFIHRVPPVVIKDPILGEVKEEH